MRFNIRVTRNTGRHLTDEYTAQASRKLKTGNHVEDGIVDFPDARGAVGTVLGQYQSALGGVSDPSRIIGKVPEWRSPGD